MVDGTAVGNGTTNMSQSLGNAGSVTGKAQEPAWQNESITPFLLSLVPSRRSGHRGFSPCISAPPCLSGIGKSSLCVYPLGRGFAR